MSLFLAAACTASAVVVDQPAPVGSVPSSVLSPAPPAGSVASTAPSGALTEEVVALCEAYRKAVEARDVEALLAMASPNYQEDGGTPDPSDDIDYEALREYLRSTFRRAESIRYELRVRSVHQEGDRVRVRVTYSAAFRGQDAGWTRLVEEMELVLERLGGKLLFVSGM